MTYTCQMYDIFDIYDDICDIYFLAISYFVSPFASFVSHTIKLLIQYAFNKDADQPLINGSLTPIQYSELR